MANSDKNNNVIFINLSGKETFTIRTLPDQVTVEFLKAKLELVTGFHGSSFQLSYGEIILHEDDTLYFNKDIRSGSVLTLVLPQSLVDIYEAVLISNVQQVIHQCMVDDPDKTGGDGDPDDKPVFGPEDKTFFSLLIACRKGCIEIINSLLRLDSEGSWRRQCTQFGRTLAHITVASDQTKVLDILLDQGASVHIQDHFQKTPLDTAVYYGAYACERLIKQSMLRKKKTKDVPPSHTKKPVSGRRVCWDDEHLHIQSDPKNNLKSRHTYAFSDAASLSSMISGTSVTSSRQSSACSHYKHTKQPSPRATIPHKETGTSSHSHQQHKSCASRPPFMAYRIVTPEELRPVAVEYVPLDTITRDQCLMYHRKQKEGHNHTSFPAAPRSSPTGSKEDLVKDQPSESDDVSSSLRLNEKQKILQKREEVRRKYSRARRMSSRAQSAKYHKTRYHLEAEDNIPKARPATAGSRYRSWKTWLAEKMEQDAEKEANSPNDEQKRKKNDHAFRKWLSHKNHNEIYGYSSDESSASDYDEENEKAYKKWTNEKKHQFEKMDKKRTETIKETAEKPKDAYGDRKVTIFKLGHFSNQQIEAPDPDNYMRAYQAWKETKDKFENWKRKKGLQNKNKKPVTKDDIIKLRGALMLEGITYKEWLGLKEKEQSAAKLHLHKIDKEV